MSGAENGLSIDTHTVENATGSQNLYGFYLSVDGVNVVPQRVELDTNEIILHLPTAADLTAADSVYVYYAGKNAKGTGNIRDNCTKIGFYSYLDDSADTGTGNNQGVSHSALDAAGNSIVGQKYPMYNWLQSPAAIVGLCRLKNQALLKTVGLFYLKMENKYDILK